MKDNPYVGPRPYERQERHNFFGREREERELRSLILSEREVLFYAQSGAGKTSLLNAKVIPTLEEEEFLVLPLARVGSEVPPGIDPTAVDNVFAFSVLLALAGEDVDPQSLLRHTLRSFLEERHASEERPLVLILDQFEELFTSHRDRWQEAERFLQQVRGALDSLPALGVVLVMREDHVAALDPFLPLFPRRLQARFRMERLGFKGALAAIRRPAENAGCRYDDGVAEQLVDDLRRIKVQRQAGAVEETVLGPFVEAVQLQIVCSQLWQNLPEPVDRIIRWKDVEAYGDVDRALTGFYEQALARARQALDGARSGDLPAFSPGERQLRRWFGQQLITPMGTRGLVLRGPEETAGLPNAAVDALESLHIIRADARAGARWYELAHDRLVEPILTANRIWRAKHTSPLTLAAEAWLAADRDPHKLYRGEQLKDAQAQAEAHPGELAELEKEFIDESLERARLESAKRQRLALFGTMGLLVVFLILAVWALYSAGQARVARDRSDQARATAEAASEIAIAEREEARFQRDRAAAAQAEAEAASETAIAEREEARIQRDRAAAAQADAEAARTEIQRLLEQKKYLSETGWGVIFAHDADPAVRQALSELLDHRREQATREQANYYKEYTASDGYRTGETAQEFLERQGASIGPVDPGEIPYYLLIVGDPESIPYEFQYQLDTKYAVGRIHFQELEDYENYARSVVQAETGEFELPRQVGMFSPVHEGERATELMYTALTEPLYQHLKQTKADWQVNASVKDDATKAQLARLLGGDQTPALLFNASHSVGFPLGDPRQITDQGAVVCQDWPFGGQGGGPAHYFSADDVDKDARLLGLIVFSFSEFGAGTPKQEDFWFQWYRERREIAPYAFVAPLPQRLLSHPAGGALAFIGHIENTWAFSVMQPGAATEREVAGTFSKAIDQLLDGYPVGAAMEPFDQRYAELAADLTAALRENEFKLPESDDELIDMLTMVTDARNYVIIGDPAVRLMVAEGTGTLE